ncbi:hypothetical protein BCV69DRAFT_207373 [Microstroma glucosiphilum]|uniref:Uncharacterized protein n=1 Tax=Pseudomicrostroma glucosiphilum TaxID=1684307 RepID=A0A316U539_9BASI|nr:hypothetical protein BCV69DRAFT_207373 [Pseudomicrostroma glucosiphilum]PWN20362.1 hypothetical protein BCV69DRAFT_207373 [Pseudomicrostroma glucosiphilum]
MSSSASPRLDDADNVVGASGIAIPTQVEQLSSSASAHLQSSIERSNVAPHLFLDFPLWYHLFINFLEPLSTAIAIVQLFFWPLSFLQESLPTLADHYTREGTQPILTELGGAWTLVLFLEVVLLSPLKCISPLPHPYEEVFTAGGSAGFSGYSLRLKVWRYTLGTILLSDCVYFWSLAQENPLGWAGVLVPWNWRTGLQATTVLLSLVGSSTRIAFLAGVGIKKSGEEGEVALP